MVIYQDLESIALSFNAIEAIGDLSLPHFFLDAGKLEHFT